MSRIVVAVALVAAAAVAVAAGAAVPADATAGCQHLAHIGDSTTIGMKELVPPAYARVGWPTISMSAGGGRAIKQALAGDVSGAQAASAFKAAGFNGCWVVALGTNDTANVVAAGGTLSEQNSRRRNSIDAMMTTIGAQPVMWVNVHLNNSEGYYTAEAARAWNAALLDASARYGNLYIYDWDSAVAANPAWMAKDQIHYNATGYQHRSRLVAEAAQRAFDPSSGGLPAPAAPSSAPSVTRPTASIPIVNAPMPPPTGPITTVPASTLPANTFPANLIPSSTAPVPSPPTLESPPAAMEPRPSGCSLLCRW